MTDVVFAIRLPHMFDCCSYLIDLTYVILLKTEGRTISGSGAVQRLVESRIVGEGEGGL